MAGGGRRPNVVQVGRPDRRWEVCVCWGGGMGGGPSIACLEQPPRQLRVQPPVRTLSLHRNQDSIGFITSCLV